VPQLCQDYYFFLVDRGYDFRADYGKLGTIASIFPSKPFIALTATAPVAYQDAKFYRKVCHAKSMESS